MGYILRSLLNHQRSPLFSSSSGVILQDRHPFGQAADPAFVWGKDGDMDEDKKNTGSYRVGYCRPPRRSQFRKGCSGNPRGRPKGSLNIATLLRRTLSEKVTITENGRRKSVSKLHAGLIRVADKAAGGDLKAIQILNVLIRSAEDSNLEASVSDSISDEADKQVFLGILERMKASDKEAK